MLNYNVRHVKHMLFLTLILCWMLQHSNLKQKVLAFLVGKVAKLCTRRYANIDTNTRRHVFGL